MALASYEGTVRVRDLATWAVLPELLASQRFHEGVTRSICRPPIGSTAGGSSGETEKAAVNRIEQAPSCLLRD
jgi:hypothetical protein